MKLKKFLALVNVPIVALTLFATLTASANIDVARATGTIRVNSTIPTYKNDVRLSFSRNSGYSKELPLGTIDLAKNKQSKNVFIANFGTSPSGIPRANDIDCSRNQPYYKFSVNSTTNHTIASKVKVKIYYVDWMYPVVVAEGKINGNISQPNVCYRPSVGDPTIGSPVFPNTPSDLIIEFEDEDNVAGTFDYQITLTETL
jgi:hypothetical protein